MSSMDVSLMARTAGSLDLRQLKSTGTLSDSLISSLGLRRAPAAPRGRSPFRTLDQSLVDRSIEHRFAFSRAVFPLHVAQDLLAFGGERHDDHAALDSDLDDSSRAASSAAKPWGFSTKTSEVSRS